MSPSPDSAVYQTLAWIKASPRKQEILTSIEEGPKNSTDFAERWDVSNEAVRWHFKDLEQGGPDGEYPPLIKCLTPGRNRYKLYGLTERGEEIVNLL